MSQGQNKRHRTRCPNCGTEIMTAQVRYYHNQKAKGLCAQCPKPVVPGFTQCAYHKARNRDRMRVLKRSRKILNSLGK